MVDNANQIINNKPELYNCCRNDLSDKPEELLLKRQEFDIPVICPIFIEYRIFKKSCYCGNNNNFVFQKMQKQQ
jgi:hypothetical protein